MCTQTLQCILFLQLLLQAVYKYCQHNNDIGFFYASPPMPFTINKKYKYQPFCTATWSPSQIAYSSPTMDEVSLIPLLTMILMTLINKIFPYRNTTSHQTTTVTSQYICTASHLGKLFSLEKNL